METEELPPPQPRDINRNQASDAVTKLFTDVSEKERKIERARPAKARPQTRSLLNIDRREQGYIFVHDAIVNSRLKMDEFGREPVNIKRNAERSTRRIEKMGLTTRRVLFHGSGCFGDMDR